MSSKCDNYEILHTHISDSCHDCLSLSPATSQLVLSLSFTALFSGKGIFLECCCMVGKVGKGGGSNDHDTCQYTQANPILFYMNVLDILPLSVYWLVDFQVAYHILGCDKNKDSFFIYYHILTFGKFLPKYEGKACRFLHTNSKLLPLISDKKIFCNI